jgi:nucleoside-diphosphate-sugar epimerase
MIALVTGANGFVGSHLVRALLHDGWTVRAMVRKTSDLSLLQDVRCYFAYGDVTDPGSLDAAVSGADVIFHVAGAISSLTQSGFDRINRDGTVNLVDACLKAAQPPRRFLLVSSIAAAGPATRERRRTEHDEPKPVSMYGYSKLAGETALQPLLGHIDTTIVRPPIVYGPGDTATLDLYTSVQQGVIPRVSGGDRPLSLIHAADLVRGMILAATHSAAVGQTFYLCGPEDRTMVEFQLEIARQLSKKPIVLPIPLSVLRLAGEAAHQWQSFRGKPRPFGRDKVAEAVQESWAMDPTHAAETIGFQGAITLSEGIADAIAWYRSHGWLRA